MSEQQVEAPRHEGIDAAIIDLVNTINARGIRTFQSCSGHEGSESHPSGHVWLEPDALSIKDAERLSQRVGIEQVALLFGREVVPVWEIQFAGETLPEFRAAQDAILSLLPQPASERRCVNCDHNNVNDRGVCQETVQFLHRCLCKCEFATTADYAEGFDDAARVARTLNNFAAPTSTTSERCVKCDCQRSVNDEGHARMYCKEHGCRCVFAATGPTGTLQQAGQAVNDLPDLSGGDSPELQRLCEQSAREVKMVGSVSAATSLEMVAHMRYLEGELRNVR